MMMMILMMMVIMIVDDDDDDNNDGDDDSWWWLIDYAHISWIRYFRIHSSPWRYKQFYLYQNKWQLQHCYKLVSTHNEEIWTHNEKSRHQYHYHHHLYYNHQSKSSVSLSWHFKSIGALLGIYKHKGVMNINDAWVT